MCLSQLKKNTRSKWMFNDLFLFVVMLLLWFRSLRTERPSCSVRLFVSVPVTVGVRLAWLRQRVVVWTFRHLLLQLQLSDDGCPGSRVCWPPKLSHSAVAGVAYRCHCVPAGACQLLCPQPGKMRRLVAPCQPVRPSGGTQALQLPYAFSLKGGNVERQPFLLFFRSQPRFVFFSIYLLI